MNVNLMAEIRKKKHAFERYKQTRNGKEYLEYTRARNSTKAATRKAVRDYEKEVAKKAKRNLICGHVILRTKVTTKLKQQFLFHSK